MYHIYKFESERLREFEFDIELTFEEAQKYGEVISLFDNQILRSIRDIHNIEINENEIKEIDDLIHILSTEEHSEENAKLINTYKLKLKEMYFNPYIVNIVMNTNKDYDRLYKKGVMINGKKFVRLNSSAGQARVSTVTFAEEETEKILRKRLDNGRNKKKNIVPSKYNAYFGTYGSSTNVVSTPRFCVVEDYESPTTYKVNFVEEHPDSNRDDYITEREIEENFNRFDGQGLISYEKSKEWAEELGLDYVPSCWCIRAPFCKGMLVTTKIQEFCRKYNKENYIVETAYKDENGNAITANLENIDVILSTSMFKLWDSYSSIEDYREKCEENKLFWGVSLYSPEQDKDYFFQNYQFLQTLNLSDEDIENLCRKFVEWITGVTSKNVYYAMLFLLGTDVDEERIMKYLAKGENYWIKSLIISPSLIEDKYIKRKVYDLVKKKIKQGCLGRIIVEGNFQALISDTFAMMQHVCGQKVTGLLGEDEYYSQYWNNKGVEVVDGARAPMTYRSEHVYMKLKQNDKLNDWYEHNYSGIVTPAFGYHTVRMAGSDFDYDIVATTSNETIIKGIYRDELPVAYDPPKSDNVYKTDEDLYRADKFSFGSQIGSITNRSTSAFALLPLLDEESKEYEITLNRIKNCTVFQSKQIDKAKIGKKVKGIPQPWVKRQKFDDVDSEEVKREKELSNRILLDRHPYFFIYLYPQTKSKYKNYVKKNDITCLQKFGKTIDELKNKKRRTIDENEFLKNFYRYSPVIDSNSVMNKLCHYIESVDFGIRRIINSEGTEHYKQFISMDSDGIDIDKLEKIEIGFNEFRATSNQLHSLKHSSEHSDTEQYTRLQHQFDILRQNLINICSNESELVDHLVYLLYVKNPKSNKDILWNVFGKQMYQNLKDKVKSFYIPVPNDNGEIDYLHKKYTLKEVDCKNV